MANQIPRFIKIKNPDGSITTMSYKDLKFHEETIIEDNVFYGLKYEEYSPKEINDYEKQAKKEWKILKQKLCNNPNLLLKLDKRTERYVPYHADKIEEIDNHEKTFK